MTLKTGTRLGPYEIVAPLGAGGMGEVYKARDTRLDRTVAIKVLPSHLSSSPDFRERFEREARAVSSLNHPHICTLHDVGHENGMQYLVMEYLEGETLAEKLNKGALSMDLALRYGIEIADALDKAHKHGIVHRDLKPGNIILTKSGAKLLDFGLAKLQQASTAQTIVSGVSALATEAGAKNLTAEGSIVGTFQYMAPEQLEGREIDSRTDIFAFGTVLYEMVTGKRAFTGKSQASLIAAILEKDPQPIQEILPMTPPALDRAVKTCLAKDPDDRWQTAHDVMLQLKWISDGTLTTQAPVVAIRPRSKRNWLPWSLALVSLMIAAAALTYIYSGARKTIIPQFRFAATTPENSEIKFDVAKGFAISPDGRYLVFVGSSETGRRLWLRPLGEASAKPLNGTEEAAFPFWSPDSRFVGFFALGKLRKVSIPEGIPQIICDATNGRGGAWNQNATILFCPDIREPLYRIESKGGSPQVVTTVKEFGWGHRWPVFLPDGRHFLFFVYSVDPDRKGVYAGSLDSSEIVKVVNGDSMVAYDPNGYLLYIRETTLLAQAYDTGKHELSGEPFPLIRNIQAYTDTGPTGYAPFAISANGILAHGTLNVSTRLTWFDRSGKALESVGQPGKYFEPYFSPDEKRIVVGLEDTQSANQNLWTIDLSKGISSRFTFRSGALGSPVWSPDGDSIAFTGTGKEGYDLFLKTTTGSSKEQLLLEWKGEQWPDDWSSDGRFLLFESTDPKTFYDLWVMPMTGERKPFPFLQGEGNETHSRFSPNGKWVAYVSDESGRPEVYVQAFPMASSGKFQVSTAGGDMPIWRKDGKELFYLATGGNMMAVDVRTDSEFESDLPKILFKTEILVTGSTTFRNGYLPAADGQRFIVNQSAAGPNPIWITTNWRGDLPETR